MYKTLFISFQLSMFSLFLESSKNYFLEKASKSNFIKQKQLFWGKKY